VANFTERIKIVVDVVTDGAKTGLGNFKQAVSDAEGTTNKFKAGASSAFDTVKANAGVLAAGAGAALITFGIKAVGAFDDIAKHATDMAAATGLSVEQASRWIAVADDVGISAESISTSFGKIIKGLDKKVWDDYGIATHDAGGNIRQTNDIMLDAFDKLSKVTSGSARAKEGTDLFGKSYAALSPLVGKSRDEMVKYLGAVEKGQVITDQEAEKGKKMRLAMDDLHDSLQEVTLAVGGMVAEAAPAIEVLAQVVTKVVGLNDALKNLPGAKQGGGNFFGGIIDNTKAWFHLMLHPPWEKDNSPIDQAATSSEKLKAQIADLVPVTDEMAAATDNAQNSMVGYSYAAKDAIDTVDQMKAHNKAMTDSIQRGLDEDKAALERLKGSASDDSAWIGLQQAFDDVKQKGVDAETAVAKGADDARQKTLDYAAAVDDIKNKTIDYATEVLKIPDKRVTDIFVAANPQSVQDYLNLIEILTRNRNMNISIQGKLGPGFNDTGTPHFAQGGIVPGPIGQPVPAIVHAGEEIIPVGGRSGTTTIINNWPPGISPVRVAQATREYNRRGGRQ
jgi:hypothetical protein